MFREYLVREKYTLPLLRHGVALREVAFMWREWTLSGVHKRSVLVPLRHPRRYACRSYVTYSSRFTSHLRSSIKSYSYPS